MRSAAARTAVLALLFAATAGGQSAGAMATRLLPQGGVGSPTIIDAAGNVYVTGAGSPVTPGAAQTQPGGGVCVIGGQFLAVAQPCSDAQVTKFDASGNLVFSTLLGGPTADVATALAVDSAGDVYLTGTTGGQFPATPNAADPGGASAGAFAAKISGDGQRVLYATYLPASMSGPAGIAVDAQGNAYVAGKNADNHGFVLQLNREGTAFAWTVLFSGSGRDAATSITLDPQGNIVVAGRSTSPDLPATGGVYQPRLAGAQNVFVAKIDPAGHVIFTTYLGGSGEDSAAQVKTDPAGNIIVAGATSSGDFPTTPDAFLAAAEAPLWNLTSPGGYASRLTPDGRKLLWSSYVPSSDGHRTLQSGVTSLAIGPSGDLYLAGIAGSAFPVTASAPQPCLGSQPLDAFAAHVDAAGALRDATYIADANLQQGLVVRDDGTVLAGWHLSGPSVSLAQIRFGGSGWTAPPCLSSAPLNAATLDTRGYLSPGEFLTLSGFGIGPDAGAAWPGGSNTPPLTLGGVQVLFDDKPAPLLYAQSRQVNVQAPSWLAPNSITSITVTYKGAVVGRFTAETTRGEPGLFRLEPNISTQALAENEDGTINSAANPAAPGSVVTLWGTGLGPLAQPCAAGGLNAAGPVNLAPGYGVILNPGGRVGDIEYAGGAPSLLCGVYQINLRIPAGTHSGTLDVIPGAFGPDGSSGSASVGSVVYVK
ncbi:MAG TPA: SBBP repeat-containing protein [Bryobacteraceae bacterium]